MLEISKENEIKFEKIFGIETYNKWLKKYSILENVDIQSWIRDKIDKFTNDGKDAVKFKFTTYIMYLQQYCDYNKTNNPSVFLEEKIDNRNLRLKKYLNFLYNGDEEEVKKLGFSKRPSDVSIRNQIQSRIKSFFSNRGANISFGMIARKKGLNHKELRLDKDMIKQIQAKLESIQYRLINKFGTQAGLRISDVLDELTATKSKNSKKPKYMINCNNEGYYYIENFETQKEKVIINYLFFTSELSNLLKSAYPKENLKDIDLTKLFLTRGKNVKNENGDIIGKTGVKKVSAANYLARIKSISKDLDFDGNLKTHAFRKYFSSQVRRCKKLDIEFQEHLMGHMGQNLSQSYNNNLQDINWFFKQWKLIEQLVCVDCIVIDGTNKEVLKLKTKITNLNEQLEISLKKNIKMDKRIDELESNYLYIIKALERRDEPKLGEEVAVAFIKDSFPKKED